MQKKKIFTLVFVVLFALFSQAVSVKTHLIEIDIDDLGFASVLEKFSLKFESPHESSLFKEQASRNSSSMLAWQADYNFFYPHFGPVAEKIISKSSVTYEESTQTIVLNYVLANKFSKIKTDEPRETIWSIPNTNLAAFEEQGLIIVPENTSIEIRLPQNSKIISIEPKAGLKIQNNTAVLLSGISTSTFNLEYSVQKPLSGTFGINDRLTEIISNTPTIFVIALIAVLSIIFFVKRKKINEKIENCIIKHSELEPGTVDDEIELGDE